MWKDRMPYGRRSSDTDKGSEITVVSGRAMGHVQTESGQRTGVLRVITDVV